MVQRLWGVVFQLELEQSESIDELVASDISTGMFLLFEHYPLTPVFTLITISLWIVFFVTSADSVTFVLAMMTSGGQLSPSVAKKIVWSLTISVDAAILLFSESLEGLQRMAIAAALPFALIKLLLFWSLFRRLRHELKHKNI